MEIATLLLAALACVLSLASLLRRPSGGLTGEDLEKVRQDLLAEVRLTRQELTERFSRYALVIQEADGSYRRNCGLAFMSGEDRNFLSEFMLTNRIAYLTRNVRSYAQEGAF